MPKTKIVIIGAGVMGQGLAEAISTAGYEVTLIDRTPKAAEKGLKKIGESIDREIERWGYTKSEKKAILSRIYPSSDLAACEHAEVILECIWENLDEKRATFAKMDQYASQDCIMITNTGTLSISEIAAGTKKPERVIGMHFLNPVTKIPLVEIVKGLKTDDKTFRKAVEFAEMLEKKWITVNEYPGYVTTRIIVPLLNEAMHVLMEGVASAEDIDDAMKLGFGFNVGPLALADMMGLDVVMSWMTNLLGELSDHKYNPCPILRKLVRAGHLGVKTGKGFFEYDAEGNRLPSRPDQVLEAVR